MYIADILSRAYLQESGSNMTPDYEIFQLSHEDSVFNLKILRTLILWST